MFSIDAILVWLAKKAGLVGMLAALRFRQLIKDNPGIVARFRKKQAEAAATMPAASGADKMKWVVESVLLEMQEVGNDGLTALLYGFSTALFYEDKAPPVAQQPELPPVNVPVK